jgi:uncharacterized protein DUF2735
MTTNVSGSAKIYAFPPRGRFAANNQHEGSQPSASALPPNVMTACGSSWYHDEAIQEAAKAAPARKK